MSETTYSYPSSVALSGVSKHYIWILLLAIGFSFPVGAVFEGGVEVPVSPYVIPAVVTLPILAVFCWFGIEGREKWSLLLTSLIALVFNSAALLFIDPNSYFFKIWMFWGAIGLFGIATACVMWNPKVYSVMGQVLICLGGFSLAMLLIRGGQYDAGRISVGDSNPIWMARLIGLFALGCFALIVSDPKNLRRCGFGIVVALYAMSLTGSRGPIIALLISLSLGGLLFDFKNKRRIILISAVGAGLAALFILSWNLVGSSRLLDFTGNYDDSAYLRSQLLEYSWFMIQVLPRGIGVGNFDYMSAIYPHNIYLEFLLEWGWVLGALFNSMLISGSIGLLRMPPTFNAFKLLLVYELINASFSGDITSPRFLYGLVLIGNASLLMRWLYSRRGPTAQRAPAIA